MSGGDLDGDRFCVCWQNYLLDAIPLQNIGTPENYDYDIAKNERLILSDEEEEVPWI